jgi:hypothetical protein
LLSLQRQGQGGETVYTPVTQPPDAPPFLDGGPLGPPRASTTRPSPDRAVAVPCSVATNAAADSNLSACACACACLYLRHCALNNVSGL